MKTEIISNEYADGKRVCTQKITYSKCDDMNALGQYYIRLSEILYALEHPAPDTNINQINAERQKCESLINAQHILIDGYGGNQNADD